MITRKNIVPLLLALALVLDLFILSTDGLPVTTGDLTRPGLLRPRASSPDSKSVPPKESSTARQEQLKRLIPGVVGGVIALLVIVGVVVGCLKSRRYHQIGHFAAMDNPGADGSLENARRRDYGRGGAWPTFNCGSCDDCSGCDCDCGGCDCGGCDCNCNC